MPAAQPGNNTQALLFAHGAGPPALLIQPDPPACFSCLFGFWEEPSPAGPLGKWGDTLEGCAAHGVTPSPAPQHSAGHPFSCCARWKQARGKLQDLGGILGRAGRAGATETSHVPGTRMTPTPPPVRCQVWAVSQTGPFLSVPSITDQAGIPRLAFPGWHSQELSRAPAQPTCYSPEPSDHACPPGRAAAGPGKEIREQEDQTRRKEVTELPVLLLAEAPTH